MAIIRRTSTLLVATLLALALYSPSALAQTSDEERAVEHFDNGAKHFYEGDFSRALVEFRKAYEFNPDPMILYNMSLAYSRMGNVGEALRAGVSASSHEAMPAPAKVRNDARIVALGAALTSAAIAEVLAPAAEHGKPLDPGTGKAAEPIWEQVGPIGWSGVGAATAGLLLLGYSGIVSYGLEGDIARYELTRDLAEYTMLKDDIAKRTFRGRIALYSGLVLSVAGAGLLAFDLTRDEHAPATQPRVSLGLVPTATHTTLQLFGTY
ncbi:MAG: hypothetical protein H0U74_15870 [Bradymonadaceae bacterium]|nr:hypothetical protein [Lujinxingiaceae bacterium]